jgi:hypothetical protein
LLIDLGRENSNGDDVKVEGTVMLMRLLGNFGRYGVQPFRILYKTGNNNNDDTNNAEEADGMPMMFCMAYHTLMGGHFDSKLSLLVEEMTKDNSDAVVVSMTLAIPDGGWAPPMRCLCGL